MIHVAVLSLAEPSPEGDEEMVFASLDGDSYLPVNRLPEAGDEEAIGKLFEPQKTSDGKLWLHMQFARRATQAWWWGDQVTDARHFTVGEERAPSAA